MNFLQTYEAFRKADLDLKHCMKINTSLPKKKAARFDKIQEALVTKRTVAAYNLNHISAKS